MVRKGEFGAARGFTIPGWDAAGIVEEVGPAVTEYSVGDEVFYSGVWTRNGSASDYTVVDSRIAGSKPASLSFVQSAGLAMVGITSYESLVDRMNCQHRRIRRHMLIIGGAGGVGAMAIQIAKHICGIPVIIATASRPESAAYCKTMGADYVIDHKQPLMPQLKELGFSGVDMVYSAVPGPDEVHDTVLDVLNPMGVVVYVLGGKEPFNTRNTDIFLRGITLSWEVQFGRAMYGDLIDDRIYNKIALDHIGKLMESGVMKPMVGRVFGWDQLAEAHRLMETKSMMGKIILDFNRPLEARHEL